MQLRSAALVASLVLFVDATAHADVTSKASTEVAGYHDSIATSVLTPTAAASIEIPTAGWGANGRYLVDVVTAASPDIVATASPRWTEVRHAGNLGARYKPSTFGVAASGAVSYTPDYLALSGGGQVIQDLDDKHLSLLLGYTYGHDTIGRAGTPFSVFSRELAYHGINAGVSRVVSKSLVLSAYADVVIERGDQSKPYRYVPVFAARDAGRVERGASIAEVLRYRLQGRPLEQLPLERERVALTGRLAWRGESTTLRLEQRLYTDTWGLHATTTEVRYFVDVAQRITMWPHVRIHAQDGATFWERAYVGTIDRLPALRTGDRELGPLVTLGGGGGLRFAVGKAGSIDDIALTTTFYGAWTSFFDALYVKERFSALLALGFEVVL